MCFQRKFMRVSFRYLLESGEFRFTIGPETDCRANQTAVPSGCLSSTLQTSANYYPVCDYGCSLWSSGVLCGHTESTSTCRTTCINQGWDWNYIGCLEEYATGKKRIIIEYIPIFFYIVCN